MMRTHITEEQLMLWLDTADNTYFAVGDHIRRCESCARWVGDERLFRCLLKWQPGRVAPDEHPNDETLAAYAEERLWPADMQTVSQHIVHCDRCLVHLVDLRFMMHAADEVPPADDVFTAASQTMARLMQRWLGHLNVLVDDLEPRIAWYPSISTRPVTPAPRLKPSADKPNAPSDFSRGVKADYSLIPHAPASVGFGPKRIEFETDRYRITIVISTEGGLASLEIQISDHRRHPVIDLPVAHTLPGGETVESRTDSEGRVIWLLDTGESDVRIGRNPTRHLTVTVSAARLM